MPEDNEEKSISTEVEAEERVDAENQREEDDIEGNTEEAAQLERLEVQLEEDSDLFPSDRDESKSAKHDSQSKEDEERQDEDCPFCDYMRLGPCGESFSAWEKCTDTADKDGSNVLGKCSIVTGTLTACMRANMCYYGPVLDAQKIANALEGEETVKLEHNAEKTSKSTEKQLDIQDQAVKTDDEI